jgi:hypothetical protein
MKNLLMLLIFGILLGLLSLFDDLDRQDGDYYGVS